jgi:alkyl hydroperoxide reductase subunit AhpF
MPELLDAEIKRQIMDVFSRLSGPVAILFFGSRSQNCEMCEQTLQLLTEVALLSPLLSLEIYDIDEHKDLAERFHVTKVPGFVLAAKENADYLDFGVRFAGIPAGHEFSALIHDIVLVSDRDSGLSPATREFLKGLREPVFLEVFTTPT